MMLNILAPWVRWVGHGQSMGCIRARSLAHILPAIHAGNGPWGPIAVPSCPPHTRLGFQGPGTNPSCPLHASRASWQASIAFPTPHILRLDPGGPIIPPPAPFYQGPNAASFPTDTNWDRVPKAQSFPCLALCAGIGCWVQCVGPGAPPGSRNLAVALLPHCQISEEPYRQNDMVSQTRSGPWARGGAPCLKQQCASD